MHRSTLRMMSADHFTEISHRECAPFDAGRQAFGVLDPMRGRTQGSNRVAVYIVDQLGRTALRTGCGVKLALPSKMRQLFKSKRDDVIETRVVNVSCCIFRLYLVRFNAVMTFS